MRKEWRRWLPGCCLPGVRHGHQCSGSSAKDGLCSRTDFRAKCSERFLLTPASGEGGRAVFLASWLERGKQSHSSKRTDELGSRGTRCPPPCLRHPVLSLASVTQLQLCSCLTARGGWRGRRMNEQEQVAAGFVTPWGRQPLKIQDSAGELGGASSLRDPSRGPGKTVPSMEPEERVSVYPAFPAKSRTQVSPVVVSLGFHLL